VHLGWWTEPRFAGAAILRGRCLPQILRQAKHKSFGRLVKLLLAFTTKVIPGFTVTVTLRLAVYCRSVCFGTKPLEVHNQSFFLGN
jgi:hypothetical protein